MGVWGAKPPISKNARKRQEAHSSWLPQVLSLKVHVSVELFLAGGYAALFLGRAYRKKTSVTTKKIGRSTAPLYSM
jgi:hypothetical protein